MTARQGGSYRIETEGAEPVLVERTQEAPEFAPGLAQPTGADDAAPAELRRRTRPEADAPKEG